VTPRRSGCKSRAQVERDRNSTLHLNESFSGCATLGVATASGARISGVSLDPLKSDSARVNPEELKYSDLSPLAKGIRQADLFVASLAALVYCGGE